ncbi:MAG: penicillin-binding protein 2 [Leptolyngbyaceae cyanobacterium bins.302]|nr:penicillin-binding protein 2 [Leptolyngbyaceae cyanobacterium bins.302]
MANPPSSLRSSRSRKKSKRAVVVPAWMNSAQFRIGLVWAVLMTGIGLLGVNLFYVQIVKGDALRAVATSNQVSVLRPFMPRRDIVDRSGNVLALDRPVFTLYAHPKLFKLSKQEIAEKLSPILERPVADLVKKFDEGESGIRVEYSVVEDTQSRISDLAIDGLELIQHQQRLYPYKEVAADIVGYVNADHKGQAGLELSQENVLLRATEAVQLRRMGDGSVMPDKIPSGFLNLDDLQLRLTIDTRLQRTIQPLLKKQVAAVGAKRGVVIIMDAHSGELLSLVSEPSYDPNEYYKAKPERLKTWAITDLYEPGSTFKPINVAIALEAKVATPETVVDNSGTITVDGWPIQGGLGGSSSVTEVLVNSSNPGMVHIMDLLKPDVYYQWLRRLGLGGTTGIDLPSEAPGQFRERKTFTNTRIERAVMAFGQGLSMTPMQLTQLHATIANGGKLVTPHVVQGLYTSKGQLYWKPSLRPMRQIFSPGTTKSVLSMMEGAVNEGTGKAARLPGYRVAGKTGTSQKANEFGGYSESAYVTSFVSIFPADKPRYVILTVIDEPAGGGYGGTVAAPVTKDVIRALANLKTIAPTSAIKPEEPESAADQTTVDQVPEDEPD